MRKRKPAKGKPRRKGLNFHHRIDITAGGIAVMSDGNMPAQLLYLGGIGTKIVADMAKRAMGMK